MSIPTFEKVDMKSMKDGFVTRKNHSLEIYKTLTIKEITQTVISLGCFLTFLAPCSLPLDRVFSCEVSETKPASQIDLQRY